MQRYDMNENFTHDFNANADTNAGTGARTRRIPVFSEVKRVLYI